MRIGWLVFTLLTAHSIATFAQGRAWPQIFLAPVQGNLSSPVHVTHAGDGSGRLFIVEQAGRIRIRKNGALLDTPFLDIGRRVSCCGERGLLSVAFPPHYRTKPHFYVYYTDSAGDLAVARYRVTANPDVADPASEEVVLKINHPVFSNHNGGQLAFGPDGYLYIGTGDGGGSGDPENHAQNSRSLLGKILRIDVESGVFPYAIPATNPYRGNPTNFRGEIWALGVRNPWRFSFDRRTGDLYIGDVGQDAYEEIDFQSAASRGGENYGWRCREGLHGYAGHASECTGLTLTDPVAEYSHDGHCSVTGGAVYRGRQYGDLNGIYFYGDFCSGQIWGLRFEDGVWTARALLDSDLSLSSFGEDEDGELYVTDLGGTLYRINGPSSAASGVDLAGAWRTLRQTCNTRRTGARCTLLGRLLIWNQGTQRAARRSRTKFYLSNDAVLSAEDAPLRSALTGRIKAGTTRHLILRKSLPPGRTALHQYVIAVVDAEHRLAELDEANNFIVDGPIGGSGGFQVLQPGSSSRREDHLH
jgi:glucose/arabinose dehydrogenase